MNYVPSNISEAHTILQNTVETAEALELSLDSSATEALRQPGLCNADLSIPTFPLNLTTDSFIVRLENAANDLRNNDLQQSKYFEDKIF